MSEMPKTNEPATTPDPSELIITIPESYDPAVTADVRQWAEANNVPTVITDAKLQESIATYGLPQFRAGVVAVNRNGRILMIHEGRVQVKKIKDEAFKNQKLSEGYGLGDWVDGDGGWNLPAGRLAPGELFEDGAERETDEESGWSVTIKQHLYTRKGKKYIMPVFVAEANCGPAEFHTTETRETLEIAWLTPAEIRKLHAENQLRSPEFVSDALDAYEALTV